MKVIAKKQTAKLVKGSEYEVTRLKNSTASKHKSITVKVGDVSYHSNPNNFTMLDGKDLPLRDWNSSDVENLESTYINDVRKVKKGDIVICKYSSKLFIPGNMYRISDILYEEKQVKTTWSQTPRTIKCQKIKVEGYNGWLSPHRFRTCTSQEKRSISLGGLLGETVNIDTKFAKVRKIDRYDEKTQTKVIIQCLVNSIMDPSRHEMSVIDWTLQKVGKKEDLNMDDLKKVLNKKFSQLIKEVDDI